MCFKSVSKVFKVSFMGILRSFKGVPRKFKLKQTEACKILGFFKKVSRNFQGCFMGVSNVFQECFIGV